MNGFRITADLLELVAFGLVLFQVTAKKDAQSK